MSFHFLNTVVNKVEGAGKAVGHDVIAVDKTILKPLSFLGNLPANQGLPSLHPGNQVQSFGHAAQDVGRQAISFGAPVGSEIYNRVVAPVAHLPQETFNTKSLGLGNQNVPSISQTYHQTHQTHGAPLSFLAAGATAAGALPFGPGKEAEGLIKSSTKDLITHTGQDIGNPALHLPAKGIYAKLTPQQQLHLADETKNIPVSGGDVPHLTQLDILKNSTHKEVPMSELTAQSPNVARAIKGVDIAQQLVHAKSPQDAFKTLTDSGVDPVTAKRIAPAVASTKDPNIINNIITRAHTPPPTPEDIIAARTPPRPPEPAPIATKLPTDLPKQPNIVQKGFLSVRGQIAGAGLHGQDIADRLQESRNASETGQAQFVQKIPTVLSLNKNEFSHFVNTLEDLDKGAKTIDAGPKVQQAIKEWTGNIQSIRDRAESAGLKVGDLGPNYFPRNYTELLKNQEGINKAANHLVDTGQADSIGEALHQIEFMKGRYSTPYGHFEQSRKLDLPGYDKSKNALLNYISGAHDRIANAEQFGPKGEIARQLIASAGAEGHSIPRLLDNYQIATGVKKYNETGEKVSSTIRGVQRFRSLGLSSLLNATQSTNTASVAGIFNTAKSALELFSPTQKQYIKDSGVIIDTVINNLREGGGVGKSAIGKATAPLFGHVERFNRSVAAVAGKNYANKLASKGGEKELAVLKDKLGVQGNIGKKLTPEQEIQAGRKMVELVQFKVDPQDLPGWTSSPGGKLVAQFRTFSYKQTGFIYNELLKEASKGNVAPLARFLAVGIPMGIAAGGLRNKLKGQVGVATKGNQEQTTPESDAFHEAMAGLGNIGAFGLGPGDASFLVQNRKSTHLPEYAAGAIGGPTAGLAVGLTQDAQQAASGNYAAAERRGLKSLSAAGPALSNKLVPFDGLNKTEKTTLDSLKKQGAPQKQVDSYKTFFQTKPPSATSVNKDIDKALEANDFNKATQLAKDYNSKVEKAYADWAKKYGNDVPDDLYNRYTGKYINPDGFDARQERLQTPILNR